MGERDFTTKSGRKAFREFCEKYCEKLSILEAELKILAIRAGGMLAALEELGDVKSRIKGICKAARDFDDKCELARRKI